jgi:hypothetical protein
LSDALLCFVRRFCALCFVRFALRALLWELYFERDTLRE